MRIKNLGEMGLIKRIASKTRCGNSVIKGIGDDTAVMKWTKDKYLLATCDMLVEDVHFALALATPFQVGWKAMARNVSDIAAMGGVPLYALVSVGINPRLPVSYADGLYKGMSAAAAKFGLSIIGGDTARSGKLVIDVSVIGQVEKKRLVLRSGAKKGDLIILTGSVGGSINTKHLNFIPRIKEARMLVKGFKINSMIDISDGLALDLWRILDASDTGATIYKSLIPVSRTAVSFEKAITDGEDFELLFTMAPTEARRFLKAARSKIKTPFTPIGEITDKSKGYKLIYEDGKTKTLKAKGYLHF